MFKSTVAWYFHADNFYALDIVISKNCGEFFSIVAFAKFRSADQCDVIAVEDSVVLFFDVNRIILTCPIVCPFHKLVVQNLFFFNI